MHYKETPMAALSLRLPDDLEARLNREAKAEGRPRSEVAREAIAEYLARREKERFMGELATELRQAYADTEIRREALAIAEAAVDDGLDAVVDAEQSAGIDPGEKWWQ
jgi:predicted transcriptional regulator